ncbi:AraC family transcriptional regulator [Paraburkholderia megapolitana]|uniref:Transcriptional regulator, AraC family n=1 Tax=Paraburkholderia megapolitana TaxID=420953 RepID=A0A1I3TPS4_9BURK|nr:AraC family transcriptional regulator [Paraburkholderia megapolitana]QDQ83425.1 AraC family transcriptional regulator [Paraburkholderia megapolitana]SFJ72582.1 transcriptional regulator, AraC family [Paraburkholderia megapolitana]
MTKATSRNDAHYWRSALIPGGDMVTARFTDHVYSPHWHDAYTVSVIEQGAERYDYRGTRFVADAGSLPIINPGEIHTGSSAGDAGWQCRTFYLPVDFVQTVASETGLSRHAIPWFNTDIIKDADLVRRALLAHRTLEASSDLLASEYALLDAVSTLLTRHARLRPPSRPMTRDRVRVERMKTRMLDELTAPLDLSELASTVGLSKFHAARIFTREVGMAPHAWRNQVRLSRARDALRAGMSATEVAATSGFTDQSHFNRHFKKASGVSPGRWSDNR